jgi:hypothetical protein
MNYKEDDHEWLPDFYGLEDGVLAFKTEQKPQTRQ